MSSSITDFRYLSLQLPGEPDAIIYKLVPEWNDVEGNPFIQYTNGTTQALLLYHGNVETSQKNIGDGSLMIGEGVIAAAPGSLAIGNYNQPIDSATNKPYLFTIGNGTGIKDDAKQYSNIFAISENAIEINDYKLDKNTLQDMKNIADMLEEQSVQELLTNIQNLQGEIASINAKIALQAQEIEKLNNFISKNQILMTVKMQDGTFCEIPSNIKECYIIIKLEDENEPEQYYRYELVGTPPEDSLELFGATVTLNKTQVDDKYKLSTVINGQDITFVSISYIINPVE